MNLPSDTITSLSVLWMMNWHRHTYWSFDFYWLKFNCSDWSCVRAENYGDPDKKFIGFQSWDRVVCQPEVRAQCRALEGNWIFLVTPPKHDDSEWSWLLVKVFLWSSCPGVKHTITFLCFALRLTVQYCTCYGTVHLIPIGQPHSSMSSDWLLVRFYWENNTDPATTTASSNHQPAPRHWEEWRPARPGSERQTGSQPLHAASECRLWGKPTAYKWWWYNVVIPWYSVVH